MVSGNTEFDWSEYSYGICPLPLCLFIARAAFLEHSVSALEANRVLGGGPINTFISVALPSARPAIIVGMSLALMETMNDYGLIFSLYQRLQLMLYLAWNE